MIRVDSGPITCYENHVILLVYKLTTCFTYGRYLVDYMSGLFLTFRTELHECVSDIESETIEHSYLRGMGGDVATMGIHDEADSCFNHNAPDDG